MFHVKHSSPHILLINPWITDFATYNFWIKPWASVYCQFSEGKRFRITLFDCLECQTKRKTYGDGKFHKTIIEKPEPLKSIPRHYGQYGIPEEGIIEQLLSLEKPDVIAITSGMTYWYPGVIKLIEITRKLFNKVPVILGGIYATLCYEHARRYSGADYIVSGRGELKALNLASDLVGLRSPRDNRMLNLTVVKKLVRNGKSGGLQRTSHTILTSTSSPILASSSTLHWITFAF